MAGRALVGMAIAAAFLIGCDAKPPKPETRRAVSAPAGSQFDTVRPGERSIRLFGRGVSRQLQIRVSGYPEYGAVLALDGPGAIRSLAGAPLGELIEEGAPLFDPSQVYK